MISALSDFHWLRPGWLFALPPLALLLIAAAYQRRSANQWDKLIPSKLLAPLLIGGEKQNSIVWLSALAAAWLTATIALAGPSWQKLPQPVHKSQQAMVVLLDLSPSMLAQDLKPSRLVRSRYKLIDLLKARKDGLTGLVAYAGDAHVVTPLTDDTATISSLLPALDPNTMPVAGSRVEDALTLGMKLMHDSGIQQGQFLLITDGVEEDARQTLTDKLDGTPFTLSVLAVGSQEGAPIPLRSGFAKDRSGNLIISRLDVPALQALAQSNRGRFTTLAADSQDIDFLLNLAPPDLAETEETKRLFDTWQDNGAYLCLLLLPFAAAAFRRGLLLGALLITGLSVQPDAAFAQTTATPAESPTTQQSQAPVSNSWDKLWHTPDQRGQQLFKQGAPAAAANEFEDPNWKASAQYTAGDYAAAAKSFSTDTATGSYNRANALAQAGQLQEALQAYDHALELQPDMEDAQYNKKVVEDLLKKQQQQKQNQDQQQSGDDQQKDGQQSNKGSNQDNKQGQKDQQGSQQNEQNKNGDGQDSSAQNNTDNQKPDQSGEQQANGDQPSDNDKADLPDTASKANKPSGPPDQPESTPEQKTAQQKDTDQPKDADSDQQTAAADNNLTPEQAQALEQWLRQVPDDPSGLLRRKFDYEHRLREREQQWQGPPEDEQRW